MIYGDSVLFVAAADPSRERRKYQKFIADKRDFLVTSALTIDEIVWVLSKNTSKGEAILFGEKTLENVARILPATFSTAKIALELMKSTHLKPRDAFHAATMKQHGITEIVSEDKDFDKLPGIKRIWI